MRKAIYVLMTLALVLVLSLGAFACAEEEEKPGLPDMLIITTTGLASTNHILATAIGGAFSERTGIPVRLVPHGTDIARYTVLRDGDCHFVHASSVNGWAPTFGLLEFEEWGPQPIYIVWQGSVLGTGIAVRGDSDIYTGADLKGKTINNVPGMPSINLGRDNHLAVLGLTPDDMTLADFPSYSSVMEGLKLGTVDAIGAVSLTSGGMYDVAAAPCGLRWIPLPADGDWEAASKIAPYVPYLATTGAGIDAEHPLETAALTNNCYCYGTEVVTEELAYEWAKTVHTQWEEYEDKHSLLPGFTIEQALDFELSPYPYHPGAIKYFKEIGVWTDEHQEWQDRILSEMEARIAG